MFNVFTIHHEDQPFQYEGELFSSRLRDFEGEANSEKYIVVL